MRRSLALVTVLLAASGCASQAQAPSMDAAAEEQAVRAVSARWLELTRQKDAGGIAALFADDARLIWAGQQPVVGKAAIQAFLAQDFANNPNQTVHWETERVELAASGDLAVEYGTYESGGGGPDGTLGERGNFTTVFRKRDGAWSIISDSGVPLAIRAAAAAPAN